MVTFPIKVKSSNLNEPLPLIFTKTVIVPVNPDIVLATLVEPIFAPAVGHVTEPVVIVVPLIVIEVTDAPFVDVCRQ